MITMTPIGTVKAPQQRQRPLNTFPIEEHTPLQLFFHSDQEQIINQILYLMNFEVGSKVLVLLLGGVWDDSLA